MLKKGIYRISSGREDLAIPLGLLDKHGLKASFALPIRSFLYEEWLLVLYLVASAFMLGLIFYWQHFLIRKERLIRQNEELNVQTVNHDMKSPIGIVSTYWKLIELEGVEKWTVQQQSNFRVLNEEITCLESLVKRISPKFINEKGLVLKKEKFQLPVLVEEVWEAVKRELPVQKKVKFSILFRLDENVTIVADRVQLGRALGNLIRNAIKYSENEVVIVVSCIRKRHQLLISVKDNGIGIDKVDRPHIFETGYRSVSVESRTAGTGLGLSFVKMVVCAHGGKIVYRRGIGQGSKFIMIFKNQK